GTGSGRRDVLAELDRAPGARRRELDQAEIFAGGAVEVEPPSDPLVKLLRAVDIRNGDDEDLELHVNSRDARVSCGVVTTDFIGAHGYLLCSVGDRRHGSIHEGMRRRIKRLESSMGGIPRLAAKNGRPEGSTR